jgi:protoheme IX farnesyltransferase
MTQTAHPLASASEAAKSRTPASLVAVAADLVALAKPRITFMVVVTTAGGLLLARRAHAAVAPAFGASLAVLVCAILGTSLIVAGANALNMYLERDVDRKMERTKNRPLPAGRLAPSVALWFGVGLSVVAVPILAIGVNPLTALLAVLANVSYVLAYTPLKQRSHWALLVGAVPGAIPPLLGWTAATDRIDAAGMVLFAILFLWQVPHFLAIALFRRADYARAGLVVMPNVTGERDVVHAMVRYLFALVGASVLLVPLGVAHRGYLVMALLLGAVFFGWGCVGLRVPPRSDASVRWAKSLFGVSILYLVLLFAALSIDPFS